MCVLLNGFKGNVPEGLGRSVQLPAEVLVLGAAVRRLSAVCRPLYAQHVSDYQALYRKYRPQLFSEVIGQDHVTETLAGEVIAGKIAHAYLFAGPRGTGKTTTARILAKAINCADLQPGGEPCNVCNSCVGITAGTSMDVVELDAASHNKVEDVREIRVNVGTVASVGGARRVYILDEAHMLSRAASNALLKTLEEPPEHAHFVLATTEPYKLPDTIRSRAQRFDFHAIGSEALVTHLAAVAGAEGIEASTDGLALIVRHATGSARDALSLLEQVAAMGEGAVAPKKVARALGLADSEVFGRVVAAVAAQDAAAALTLVSEVASVGADLRRFTAELLEQFRGLFLVQYAPNVEEIVDEPADVVADWRSLSAKVSAADVLRCIDLLGAALSDLRDGREERLIVELTLLKMSRPETSPDVPSLISRVDRLEERMKRGVPPTVPPGRPRPSAAAVSGSAAEPMASPVETEVAGAAEVDDGSEAATDTVEAAPTSVPEAAPATDLDLDAFIEKWPMVVTRVREAAGPRRFAVFRDARPVRVDGSKLVITVPGPFHRDQLIEDRDLADVVATALADVAGGKVGFTYEADGNAPLAAAPVVPTVEERAPDQGDLVESDEGAIDPTALVVDLLGGEVVEQ